MAQELSIWIESLRDQKGQRVYSLRGQYEYEDQEDPDEWYDYCENCGITKGEIQPEVDNHTRFCSNEGCYNSVDRKSEIFEIARSASKMELSQHLQGSSNRIIKELLKDPTLALQRKPECNSTR